MPSVARSFSKGFWAQYPVGTKLNWSFVALQVNMNLIALSNFAKLELSQMGYFTRVWQVLVIPLFTNLDKDILRPIIPQSSRVAAFVYVATAYPLGYLIAAIGFVVVMILFTLVFTILPILAVVVVSIWLVLISLTFATWLIFYRYPVFEVIYPRVRNWMLVNNSHVYSRLSPYCSMIRVVCLQPGSNRDDIVCELVTGPLIYMDYEALSYVWGVTVFPHKISMDQKPFYVTYNLHTALKELRFPDRKRYLWIDAICINQHDYTEKASQVQMMRDIYAKASKTIVWLGPGTKATASTFQFVEQLIASGSQEASWKVCLRFPQWRRIRREIEDILEYEWWGRAWIIQEVVMSSSVAMQRGSYQVPWETLHDMLVMPAFFDEFPYHNVSAKVAQDVQALRSEGEADEPISNTLLGLVYRFRLQSATFSSDKIYALMGLLKGNNPTLLTPDYSTPPEDVFMQFTVATLKHNKILTAIALAAGVELQSTSWCRDWRLNHDPSFHVLWFSTYPPSTGPYNASGTQPPVYEIDYQKRMLSLQGYESDKVIRVGDFNQSVRSRVDWNTALLSWERVVGVPLPEESEIKAAFDRTITAGYWATDPIDWRTRVLPMNRSLRTEEEKSYNQVLEDVCINRRFFVTKNGRFGLGPWNMKKDDVICILFGGKAPFVLRRCAAPEDGEKSIEEGKAENYYKVIGEAFVDGLMYYNGSLEDDITVGQVVPQWYNLL